MEITKVVRPALSRDIEGAIGRSPRGKSGPLRLGQGVHKPIGPALAIPVIAVATAATLPPTRQPT